ncbi:MAG: glycosyltransferase family 2 protein [Bacteroidales bacterium]|nr:glycosyltransferase family 2 protein [Bacteroidales bacterium]
MIFIVNQPESFWLDINKRQICLDNAISMEMLEDFAKTALFPVHIIDRSSKGKGWKLKDQGVGQARREAMDLAIESARDEDIILSTDADTMFFEDHIEKVRQLFTDFPQAGALSIPFYHMPDGSDVEKKAILRYEMYMRYYLLNLIRIGSPYAYTAIGSAMACTVKAYKRIGGLAPKVSGEDFYFMMQLRKTGALIPWCDTTVNPSPRASDRVIFGTGTAVAYGIQGDWSRYIFYDMEAYDRIADANQAFSAYFDGDEAAKDRILSVFPDISLEKLRKNHPVKERFIHACHEKADSLAILQTLKRLHSGEYSDSENLVRFCKQYTPKLPIGNFSFESSTVYDYLIMRDFLFAMESEALKKKHDEFSELKSQKLHPIWKYMI